MSRVCNKELVKMRPRLQNWAKRIGLFAGLLLATHYMVILKTYLPGNKRSLMCSFGEGRLGNQLSAFATIFAYSQQYGYTHVMLAAQAKMLNYYFEPKEALSIEILETSDLCVDVFGRSAQCRGIWQLPWTEVRFQNDRFYNYSNVDDQSLFYGHALNIGEYPNQIKSFYKFLPALQSIFSFRPRFQQHAQAKLHEAANFHQDALGVRPSVFVGVHIRRTDYQKHLKNIYKIEQVSRSYFHRAMDMLQAKHRNTALFIIVSDDLEWAKDQLIRNDVAFAGNTKVLPKDVKHPFSYSDDIGQDLALLASCNHTIMSFGTFGLWGGLLSGGDIVLPKQILGVKEGLELKEAGLLGPSTGFYLV
eukprot:TRINITY_DN5778_c0_g1_i5.p1 TRINITY_DN5778_c0_g1~~TRINITY_DN5778_c0_g1_i5.p1  ORF type:complete len:361 (-),score=37.89 TRINITY_DN5778_c0_g1_i5:655-1737(-)